MKILLLGATGQLGGNILEALNLSNHEVTVLVRPQSVGKLSTEDCHVIETNDPIVALGGMAGGFDWIIDAAAPYFLDFFVPPTELEAAANRTATMLQWAKSNDVAFAYVSSFITLPRQGDSLLSRWKRRSSPYYLSKMQLERLVLAALDDGLTGLVVNPSACIGPGDLRPYEHCVIPLIINNELPMSAKWPVSIVDVRDVASGIVKLIEEGGSTRPVPMFGNDVSTDQLVASVGSIVEIEEPLALPVSPAVLSLGAGLAEAAAGAVNLKLPAPAVTMFLMMEDYGSYHRGHFLPTRSFDTTIRDAISWYQQIGYC